MNENEAKQTVNNVKMLWDPHCKPQRTSMWWLEYLKYCFYEGTFGAFDDGFLPWLHVFQQDMVKGSPCHLWSFTFMATICSRGTGEMAQRMTISPNMSSTMIAFYKPPSSNIMFYEYFNNLLKECDYKKEIILTDNINKGNKTCRKKLTNQHESDNWG